MARASGASRDDDKSMLDWAIEGWRAAAKARTSKKRKLPAGSQRALAWLSGAELRRAGLECPIAAGIRRAGHESRSTALTQFGLAIERASGTMLAVFATDGKAIQFERIWQPYRESSLEKFAIDFPPFDGAPGSCNGRARR
jgi:hypothetical protein